MAYRLRRKASVQKSVVKIAREQVDKAVHEILDRELDRHEVVHQVRKRCKKLRALIRLVRPAFQDYQRENIFFRDAARQLSYVRDAQSILECFDGLIDRFGEDIDVSAYAPIRKQLAYRRQAVAKDQAGLENRLAEFLAKMKDARQRLENWRIDADGFSAVEGGLRKTYRRGRSAFHEAYENPSAESFHEWRKRAKYHWYHLRLLQRIWQPVMAAHIDAGGELCDLLGKDHDLAVLRGLLLDEPEEFASTAEMRSFAELIDRRCDELRCTARPLGERIFAEKPKWLAARFRVYWETWTARRRDE